MTLVHSAVASWPEPAHLAARATVLVVPGRGESAQIYERFGRRLASDAYRVHAVTAPTESLEQSHDQLVDLLEVADPAIPRVVVGSDAGAAYAAHLAAQSQLPNVSALVLAGLPTAGAPTAPAVGAVSDGWDAELDLRTSCPTHRLRITESGVRRAELFAELPAEWLDPANAARIAVPVLGVHGQADAVSPLAAARAWYRDVRTAELVVIADGVHDALNDQPHRTAAATVVLFLERLRLGADLAPIALNESLR